VGFGIACARSEPGDAAGAFVIDASFSSGATRGSASSGMPKKSDVMPSGMQISSATIRLIGRPSARRATSPRIQPKVLAW